MGRWVESLWWADTESLWQGQVAWCGGTSSGPPGWTPLGPLDGYHYAAWMDTIVFP